MIDPLTRPEKLSNAAVLFLVIAPIVVLNYLVFILNPINADNYVMYGLQLTADLFSFLSVLGLWLTILLDLLTPPHQSKDRQLKKDFLEANKPTIDIFIPVANEPLEIIAHTVIAAIDMNYSHNVFILDDGKSDEVKELAQKLRVNYVRRDKNEFAKSGNINNGLSYSKADFFAILDADFVPTKDFITVLLGYMEDEQLAFVQSPQSYSNMSNFIASGTAGSQEIFYKYVSPAKNSSESAFCVGTNVVFRRKAIDQIGGIAQLDHSEDIWTSLHLHELGWKSLFINKVLAVGQAPESIQSFFNQQKRWAQGGFSIFFQNNPLFSEKLTFDQKIQYLYTTSFYFVGFSILIYLLLPILYLMLDLSPIKVQSSYDWVIHYIPYFSVLYLLSWFLLGRIQTSIISTSLATFYPYILGFISSLSNKKHVWIATSSQHTRSKPLITFIWPHILLICLSIGGLIVAWYDPRDVVNTSINSVWALLNAIMLALFIDKGIRKKPRLKKVKKLVKLKSNQYV